MKAITERVVLIRVDRTYRPNMSDDALYAAVHIHATLLGASWSYSNTHLPGRRRQGR